MGKYKQIEEGEGFPLAYRMKIACCDCGLVHWFEIFNDDKGIAMIKATRDRRATAALRREDKKRRERTQ